MQRQGYSLVELLLVLGLMGAVTAVALPRLPWQVVDRYQTRVTARQIMSDLRRTRSMALSQAASSSIGFSLVFTRAEKPAFYEIRNVHTDTVLERHLLEVGVRANPGHEPVFTFGPLGNLLEGSATQMIVVGAGEPIRVNVESGTGRVSLVADS